MSDESARLLRIHDDIDAAVAALARRHEQRLRCGVGCTDCCVDDLTVFEVEAERIRSYWDDRRTGQQAHPAGRCAFLSQAGECRIYAVRPYVCRTQGLPLRWVETTDREPVEYRDICPLNENDEPLQALPADDCWTLGSIEGRLAQLQSARGTLRRVALRELFGAARDR